MAEPKKKITTKKVAPSAKKTTPKKTTVKKAPVKKTTPVVEKTVVKKIPKKTPVKKSSAKTSTATAPHFTKDLLPEMKLSGKKKLKMDTSIFTTVLALFIVALVVLWGYIYSGQNRMIEPPADPIALPVESSPQNIRISSAVSLTPDVVSALENIVTQIAIGPEEVLENVRVIDDVVSAKSESPDFFANAQMGDYVFQFKSASLLYRPSTTEIIITGILPK